MTKPSPLVETAFDDKHAVTFVAPFEYPNDHACLDDIFSAIADQQFEHAARGFREMILWAAGIDTEALPQSRRSAGLRIWSAAWVLFPERFQGISLTKLAERLGCSKQMLSDYCVDFCVKFNVPSRALKSRKLKGTDHGD